MNYFSKLLLLCLVLITLNAKEDAFNKDIEVDVEMKKSDLNIFSYYYNIIGLVKTNVNIEKSISWDKIEDTRSSSIVVDYTSIWKLLGIFLLLLSIVFYFLIRQNRLKKRIENLNQKLGEKVIRQVKELRESTVMFETIFETVKDGIAILDSDSNFLLVNKAYEKMTGFTKEELYKTSCIELTAPNMIEESKRVLKIIFEKGYYGGYEKQCIAKTDKIIDVKLDIILMPDKKSILIVTKDMTRQKEYEMEKEKQNQHMFQQSKLAQMGEMISMIAHQWRQPLAAIAASSIDLKMKIELELYDLEDEQGRESCQIYFSNGLDNIEHLTQSLTTTIDDFRDFYKPNKLPKIVGIDEPIQKALNIIRTSLVTDNIIIVEDYNSVKELSLFDSEVMQVLLNIFKNAQDNFNAKEIKEATIWISTKDTKNGIALSVCDNGGGIDEEIMDKIFDPYFSTKYDKNGTGLGLYMSKMIIQDHHDGKLSVKNTEAGVCFKIQLR